MTFNRLLWLFYRVVKKLLKNLTGYHTPSGFRDVQVTCRLNQEKLNDFITKVRWYAPDTVNFYVRSKYTADTPPNVFINKETEADIFLISSKACIIKNLFRLHRSIVVDPDFYDTEECTSWSYLYGMAMDSTDVFRHISEENFIRMTEELSHKESACCFLTGESFSKYREYPELRGMVKIICNSVVKNDEFMEYIRPDILVFADPVYHFSYNRYAVNFRRDVLKTVEKYGTYVAVPENMMPLMLAHYPALKNRLIGIGRNPEFNLPSHSDLTVKVTDNILTYLMLPLASAMCRDVYLLGADGRSPNDSMFWKHNSSVQYDSLMQTVVDAHPSFFRDRNYVEYQNNHDNMTENLFRFGEAQGRKYISLNRSYLASINSRYKGA
ncbi:MAG: hypothetical protein AB7E96_00470 [Deferribacterales bacterium]